MKKILSLMLCLAVLAGCLCFPTTAAEKDMAVYYDDGLSRNPVPVDDPTTTEDDAAIEDFDPAANNAGSSGYMHNQDDWAKADGGFVFAFDLNFLDYTACNHVFDSPDKKHPSHFSFTTGANALGEWTVFAYNAIDGRFEIAADKNMYNRGTIKTEGPLQTYTVIDSYDMRLNPGEWHRVVFRVEDVYLDIYVDGVHIIETVVREAGHSFAMLNPQHCRFVMDNLVFASIFYDVEADYNDASYLDTAIAEGLVYEHSDLNNLEFATSTDEETGEVTVHDYYDICGISTIGNFDEETSATRLVDRNAHVSLVGESDDASALSFTDCSETGAGKKFTSDLVYKGADAIDAELGFYTDWCINLESITDVADGCTVTVENGKATVKIPAGFSGEKVATFNFDVPKDESERKVYPTQNGYYRYGFYDETGSVITDGGSVYIINYILGDVNDDRAINFKDASAMLRYAGNHEVKSFNFDAANIVNDDLINMKDIVYILKSLAGYPDYPLSLPS